MPFRPTESLLPLTPISFEILLALAGEDRHGYAILQAVEARLGARLPLRTGTMYRALARLLDEGLIEEVPGAPDADDRRRTYRITNEGRRIGPGGCRAAGRSGRGRAGRRRPPSSKK